MSDKRAVVTPLKDGPNQVAGGVVVQDPDGNVVKEASTVYLCRCDFSQDKPFCDGSHRRENFALDATHFTHFAPLRKLQEGRAGKG